MNLNQQSRQIIRIICQNARTHPIFSSYQVVRDDTTYADGSATAIWIGKDDTIVNMFLFFPSCDNSGRIGSVAIYGHFLSGHKTSIENSMLLFGLPVESV